MKNILLKLFTVYWLSCITIISYSQLCDADIRFFGAYILEINGVNCGTLSIISNGYLRARLVLNLNQAFTDRFVAHQLPTLYSNPFLHALFQVQQETRSRMTFDVGPPHGARFDHHFSIDQVRSPLTAGVGADEWSVVHIGDTMQPALRGCLACLRDMFRLVCDGLDEMFHITPTLDEMIDDPDPEVRAEIREVMRHTRPMGDVPQVVILFSASHAEALTTYWNYISNPVPTDHTFDLLMVNPIESAVSTIENQGLRMTLDFHRGRNEIAYFNVDDDEEVEVRHVADSRHRRRWIHSINPDTGMVISITLTYPDGTRVAFMQPQ